MMMTMLTHDMATADVAVTDAPTPMMDRRLKAKLLILMLMDSLRPDGADDNNYSYETEKVGNKQLDMSKELMIVAQRLIDAKLLDLLRHDYERDTKPSSLTPAISEQQFLKVDNEGAEAEVATAVLKRGSAAARKKKKRKKKAKAAAKHRHRRTRLMSSLGNVGIMSQIVLMALSSITTLVVTLSIIHQSVDGSGEGKPPPALPPTSSTSSNYLFHNRADSIVNSPSPIAAASYLNISSPTITAPHMESDEDNLPAICFDTPDWRDYEGYACDDYRERDEPGCPKYGNRPGNFGAANRICCHCKGVQSTCDDFISSCAASSASGVRGDALKKVCEKAESCSCVDIDNDVKIIDLTHGKATEGLFNECRCDFWMHGCEDGGGSACDYAAEYCCGDYYYDMRLGLDDLGESAAVLYQDNPRCYCDFVHYAQDMFGHEIQPQTLRNELFSDPCAHSFWNDREDEIDSLKTIFEVTNGQNWTNKSGWLNAKVEHCQWYGVTCNSDGFVIAIELRNNNLRGQFPVYSRYELTDSPFIQRHIKNGIVNLYSLESLDLADNHLTGNIDFLPLYRLDMLTHFDISGNELTGMMDALISPFMTHANFSNNRFTSMRRFQTYKISPRQTYHSLDVSNNDIEEDATGLFWEIPVNIEELIASNNNIYGSLPATLNNLPKLRQFDMSFNALSGQLPVFEGSQSSIEKLDVSNQAVGFTEAIPVELWRLEFIKVLNIAGNKLTGTLPSSYNHLAVIEELDLSSNFLSGEIPSQLGQLDGTITYLNLANNEFTGMLPYELNDLLGVSVFLKDNSFDINVTAPLSICTLSRAKTSDLTDDTRFCPVERTLLGNFFDSAKGAEWTDGTNWKDEYLSHCNWKGVKCVNNKVTELNLANNGLSGRLGSSIGGLTYLEVLDLSDNDIKGPIPTEIGLLSNLKFLRLSYNAFTGEAPEGLANLNNLELLQLQSNRITRMPNIPTPALEEGKYGKSTFVTDCGVPSAFEEALVCEECTMCCNADEDCYPQEKTTIEGWGLTYGTFAAALLWSFTLLCCVVVLSLYCFRKHCRHTSNTRGMWSHGSVREQDDDYALSRIGSDSVYSYFVTDMMFGWLIAFATLAAQAAILIYFIMASEVNLQDDITDIEFTWKCPRDTEQCSDKSDLENAGWIIFSVLMVTFLAKDMINGSKLIYYSSKRRHPFWARMRYFTGGLSLCLITLFSLYVSTVYNKAIATSNTDIVVNVVIVLFINDIDEWIFAAIEATNEDWTKHTEEEDTEGEKDDEIGEPEDKKYAEMNEEIAIQKEQIATLQRQIASQEEELRTIKEMVTTANHSNPNAQRWVRSTTF